MKRKDRQVCSHEVYDLLTMFNGLPTREEQEEVLDVIYDAMYDSSYREVIGSRVIRQLHREIEQLKYENLLLTLDNESLEGIRDKLEKRLEAIDEAAFGNGKKNLMKTKRNLLAIINTVRRHVGEQWEAAFGEDASRIDSYLENVDTQHILRREHSWVRTEDFETSSPAK